MFERVIIIVLDSVGIGAMPDAEKFGDGDADTLRHIFRSAGPEYRLPNMARLGLYDILRIPGCERQGPAEGSFGIMASLSPAKDTTAGHWELAGVTLEKPFPVFPGGFPVALMEAFEARVGTRTLGNVAASGTEIIARLGDEHCRTGYPIVYTSADSVFQIAAHEQIFGLERLYAACRAARELLAGEYAVGRVIARPFTGASGAYARTANRRDFSLSPFGPTILDRIKDAGGVVDAVGKIEDIFNARGITRAIHTRDNNEGMRTTRDLISTPPAEHEKRTLIFTNLVDFDMMWGHRRDVASYAAGLREFDAFLPSLVGGLMDNDLLMITADHGCDPTYSGHTDHTREYVPLLVCGKNVRKGVDLGVRATFADVAQTVAEAMALEPMPNGTSFLKDIV